MRLSTNPNSGPKSKSTKSKLTSEFLNWIEIDQKQRLDNFHQGQVHLMLIAHLSNVMFAVPLPISVARNN